MTFGKRIVCLFLSMVLAVGLAPFPVTLGSAHAAVSDGSPAHSYVAGQLKLEAASEGDAEALANAAVGAKAYLVEQGFRAPAFKDAFEAKLPDALCYSVASDLFYVLYRGIGYRLDTAAQTPTATATGTLDAPGGGPAVPASTPATGTPATGSATPATGSATPATPASTPAPASSTTIPTFAIYDSLDAAIARGASEDAFVTRGRHAPGDLGHAYYVKTTDDLAYETIPSWAPARTGTDATTSLDVRINGAGYRFTSAEGAVSIYQLGYTGGSINDFVNEFNYTDFRTLVFPQGDYLATRAVWNYPNDKSYLGLDSTIYTDDTFATDSFFNALWYVRGPVTWGGGGQDADGKWIDLYGFVEGHETNGIRFERRTSEGHALGYGYGLFVRNARDVTMRNCDFIDDEGQLSCLQLYGNYDDVELLDITARGAAVIEIRDLCDEGGCHGVTVRGCDFEMKAPDEGLPLFAGNEQGLTDASGNEWPTLKNCLVEDVVIEDNTFKMLSSTPARDLAITCGYQDSPVRNIRIERNVFDVYAEYSFMQFGYVDGCSFLNNEVTLRKSTSGILSNLFERSDKSRTGPTTDIVVSGNTFTCPDEGTTLTRLIDWELGSELAFTNNKVTFAGTVAKLLDSTARYAGNTFELADVSSLYSGVRDVSNNTYSIGKLSSLFEGNGVNAASDIRIAQESATIAEVPNHLMGFYGSGSRAPRFNGHTLTFSGCDYVIESTPGTWRRIAYDTGNIADGVTLTLSGCSISGFDRAPYNTIERNESGKVVLRITDGHLSLGRAESLDSGGGFTDITAQTRLCELTAAEIGDDVGQISGEVVSGFAMEGDVRLDDAEVSVEVAPALAAEKDVLALYWRAPGASGARSWQLAAYAEVAGGAIVFETAGFGAGDYALVSKTATGGARPTALEDVEGSSLSAKLREAIRLGGSYVQGSTADAGAASDAASDAASGAGADATSGAASSASSGEAADTIEIPRFYLTDAAFATRSEFSGLNLRCTDTTSNNGLTFAYGERFELYFENCTFDHCDFTFLRPGTYAFVNCSFTGYPRNALFAGAEGVRLYCFDCTFADNAPDKEVWNQNISGDRHASYAAVRLRGNDTALHASGCTFQNLQTDSTIIAQRVGDTSFEGVTVCFERNEMIDCGGAGIVLDSSARGRVDDNTFRNIGATRGKDGYESTIHPTLGEYDDAGNGAPGAGVGGNALFARGGNLNMRVRGNVCENLMENGIEGTFYCICDNTVDTTGYRYDDASGDSYNGGYKTVSTEGISAGGTWYVTGNKALNVHGRGITVTSWGNHPAIVANNTVSRRAVGHPGDDASEGIKVRTDANSWANLTIERNELSGFLNNYRVLHSGGVRTCENVSITDANAGKLMGSVYSNLRGVKLTTARDVTLPFTGGAAVSTPNGIEGWRQSNLTSLTSGVFAGAEDATIGYLHMVPKDRNGRVWQTFSLPDETCIVCLEFTVRSSNGVAQAYLKSVDATGAVYSEADGGSYAEYKLPVSGIDDEGFTTQYVCFKARGTTDIGFWTTSADAWLDIASVRGWYAVDNPQTQADDPGTDNPGGEGGEGSTDNPGGEGSGNTPTDNPGGEGSESGQGGTDNPGGEGGEGSTENPGGEGGTDNPGGGGSDNPGGNTPTDNPGGNTPTDNPGGEGSGNEPSGEGSGHNPGSEGGQGGTDNPGGNDPGEGGAGGEGSGNEPGSGSSSDNPGSAGGEGSGTTPGGEGAGESGDSPSHNPSGEGGTDSPGGNTPGGDNPEGGQGGQGNPSDKPAKAANPMRVSAKAQSVKRAFVKKWNVLRAPITVTKAQGALAYAKVSGSKRLSVVKRSGKVMVKKGTKRGTYRAKVKVRAAGTEMYRAATRIVKVTVKVV